MASWDAGVSMTYHKFKVGQTVNLIPNRLDRHLPSGAYTVVRLLPIGGIDRDAATGAPA